MKIVLKLSSIFMCIIISISCSKSGDPIVKDESSLSKGFIDPALVGTWSGTVDGSFGSADMTLTLDNDGKVSAEGTTDLYCPFNGNWEVLDDRFKVEGNDECDGTSLTMNAPYSKIKLAGNWNAASCNSGTLSVEKE